MESLTVEVVRGSDVLTRRERLRRGLALGARGGPAFLFRMVNLGRNPWLVVRNRRGAAHVLWEEWHWDEARAKRDRLDRELVELGHDAWCARYKVPLSFESREEASRTSPPDA